VSAPDNEQLARRYVEDVINQGQLDLVDEIYAEDYVNHTAAETDAEVALSGREGVKDVVTQWRAAFPDLHVSIDDMFGFEDRVAFRATVRGTHDGDWAGVKATGRAVDIRIISIIRVANGQIVERWENADNLSLLQQLGVN